MDPIYSLCKQLREKNDNRDSFLLAEYQLGSGTLSETARVYYLYEQSINSFYVKNLKYGRRTSDELLLLPSSLPQSLRESVYNNSIYYAEKLPGTAIPVPVSRPPIKEGKWTSDPSQLEGFWRPLNPSICRSTGPSGGNSPSGYWVNCRTVNYVHSNGSYTSCDSDGIIRTRNFLLFLNEKLECVSQTEILDRSGEPGEKRYPRHVQGLEDCRITMDGKRVYFTTTTYDNHTFQYPLISLGTYRLPKKSKEEIIIDKLLQIPSPQNRCEKNWLPFFRKGKVAVIYSFNPVVVYTIDPMNGKFEEVARQSSGLLTDSFRGSAGPLPYKGGYLTVVHEVLFRPGRHYLHRFVELDESFNIRRLSHSFFFRSWGVEYCSGLTMSVDEKSLLLTFGFNDGEAWIHQIEITAVEELLYNPRSPIIFNPPNSIQEIVDRERGTASFPPAPLTAPLSLEYDGMVVSKLPSEIVKLEFTVTPTAQYPGIWHPMNASIILFNGFKVLCRTTNYSLDEVTRVVTTHHPQGIIQTRNFLLELDDDLSICRTTEVVEKVNRYVHPSTYQGLEDPRIFLYQGELWFTATTWDTQVERVGRITLCRLNSEYEVNFFLPLVGPNSKRIEKNWIPYENDGLHLLYLYSPLLVYTPDLTTGICKLVTCKKTPSSWEKLRGSGGVIKYADGIVVMVHEVHHSPTWIYLHRFLWLEEDYSGAKLTQPFYFTHLGVEFAAGIAEEPKTGNLIITSGLRDAESVVIKVPRTAVENLLERSTYVALT